MRGQKSKIGVKDLKARKDVKGGGGGHQNQYTNKGNKQNSSGHDLSGIKQNPY